jgi:hypothetical protein
VTTKANENVTSGQCFMNIPRWNFHWQQLYFYVTGL